MCNSEIGTSLDQTLHFIQLAKNEAEMDNILEQAQLDINVILNEHRFPQIRFIFKEKP